MSLLNRLLGRSEEPKARVRVQQVGLAVIVLITILASRNDVVRMIWR